MSVWEKQLEQNYLQVLERIEQAAAAAGRVPGKVKLVAVTKYVDDSIIRALYELGCRCFGESRPQVLWDKAESLKDLDIEWHLIGHLQTNKVKRTLPLVSLLHSGDSVKLLQAVNEEAARLSTIRKVLCEVNISGDESKHGFTPEQLVESIDLIEQLSHLQICGLMAMASRTGGEEQARRDFEKMSLFQSRLQGMSSGRLSFDELSMGMSGDFEEAIACGATLVRIGSTLYDGVQK